MSHSPPNVTHTTQIHPRAGGRAHEAAVAAAVASSASESRGGTAASQLIGAEVALSRLRTNFIRSCKAQFLVTADRPRGSGPLAHPARQSLSITLGAAPRAALGGRLIARHLI